MEQYILIIAIYVITAGKLESYYLGIVQFSVNPMSGYCLIFFQTDSLLYVS